ISIRYAFFSFSCFQLLYFLLKTLFNMHINTIQTECSLLNTVQKALQNGSKSQSKSACPQ
ncbi:hypothetical protein, partial [Prevotella pallens]|uniref:hypothetical protein n=1 Tax=Prevotella pallens TaxID=60133 RepID=UPI00288957C5